MKRYKRRDNNNTEAAAIRFQRVSIALLSAAAVILNSPIPSIIIVATALIAVLNLKSELLRLLYLNVVRRVFGKEIFRFTHIFPDSFFLPADIERFIFTVIALMHSVALSLFYTGVELWHVPAAIVAAGTTLSATTGICLMGFLYAFVNERIQKNGPGIQHTGYRNENCLVQRNLGAPLYYRCKFCTSKGSECLGMQFNLTAAIAIIGLLMIVRLSYLDSPLPLIEAAMVLITAALIRLGMMVNKKTDELFTDHHNLGVRNREQAIMLEATTAITSDLDLDHTLHTLAERMVNAVDCTFAKILLTDSKHSVIMVKAAHPVVDLDWNPALSDKVTIRPDSLVGDVLANHEPVILDPEDIRLFYENESAERCLLGNLKGIQSLCIIPVCVHGQCFGIVVLGERRSRDRNSFTQEKLELAKSLVQHAGIAIKNAQNYSLLRRFHLETTIGLAEALETRDAQTRNHSERTLDYAKALACELNLSPQQWDRLQYVAILHDIGKIGIPDSILNKPAKLTDDEFAIMKTHAEKGENIISKMRFLSHIAPLIRHHHERWDGGGYPDGLAGEQIPIESRIVAVLDSYDAMTSTRVYRPAMGIDYAISELRKHTGAQFDPYVVSAFLKVLVDEAMSKRESEAKRNKQAC